MKMTQEIKDIYETWFLKETGFLPEQAIDALKQKDEHYAVAINQAYDNGVKAVQDVANKDIVKLKQRITELEGKLGRVSAVRDSIKPTWEYMDPHTVGIYEQLNEALEDEDN